MHLERDAAHRVTRDGERLTATGVVVRQSHPLTDAQLGAHDGHIGLGAQLHRAERDRTLMGRHVDGGRPLDDMAVGDGGAVTARDA
jgi:hypothetical protein